MNIELNCCPLLKNTYITTFAQNRPQDGLISVVNRKSTILATNTSTVQRPDGMRMTNSRIVAVVQHARSTITVATTTLIRAAFIVHYWKSRNDTIQVSMFLVLKEQQRIKHYLAQTKMVHFCRPSLARMDQDPTKNCSNGSMVQSAMDETEEFVSTWMSFKIKRRLE